MLRERISLAIRRRLPGKTPEVDPTHLLAQLPTEDVINSGRLIASIKRDLPDQDLGFKAKPAWEALAEAKKAQVREPQHDFSEIIGQAQLQHGYAFARSIDKDARLARWAWNASIILPLIDAVVVGGDKLARHIEETSAMNKAADGYIKPSWKSKTTEISPEK